MATSEYERAIEKHQGRSIEEIRDSPLFFNSRNIGLHSLGAGHECVRPGDIKSHEQIENLFDEAIYGKGIIGRVRKHGGEMAGKIGRYFSKFYHINP